MNNFLTMELDKTLKDQKNWLKFLSPKKAEKNKLKLEKKFSWDSI